MSYGHNDNVYSFILTWEQPQAALVKKYKMTYYERVGKQPDIELFDIKTGKLFLKRVTYNLPEEELFLGNQVTVFARQMTVESFGDARTAAKFSTSNILVVVPFDPKLVSFLLKEVAENQLQSKLEDVRMLAFSRSDARRLAGLGSTPGAARILEAEAVLAINIRANGQEISQETFEQAMQQLQGNVWFPSWGNNGAALELLFSSTNALDSAKRTTARKQDCTVCVVKAHAVQAGHVPEIVEEIFRAGEGLAITAIKSLSLTRVEAAEFLEVYRGVVPNFPALVDELCRGRVVAIEVCGPDAVRRLREIAGPIDFSIAKQIRPHTLRAVYGVDSVKNAVHVTDLPEDGVLESEYLFDILG